MIDWDLELKDAITPTIAEWRKRMPREVRTVLLREGRALVRQIKTGIRRQAPGGKKFKPLAPSTKKMKRSSKALIDKGDLLNSVTMTPLVLSAEQAVFVGVHKGARSSEGGDLVNIAEIHEFGSSPYMITVTPKLRGWWMAMYRKKVFQHPLSPRTQILKHPGVPARPFLRPSFEAWQRGADARYIGELAKRIGLNKVGKPLRKLWKVAGKVGGKHIKGGVRAWKKGVKKIEKLDRQATKLIKKYMRASARARGGGKGGRRRT